MHRPGQRQGGRVGGLEVGHHLDLDVVGQIAGALNGLVDGVLVEVDLRLAGRAHLGVGQRLLAGLVHRLLHDLAHQRTAVHLAHVGGRHLAGAEALDVHLRRHLGDARVQLFGQIGSRHGHAVDPAQAFTGFFDDLHGHGRCSGRARPASADG